MKKIKASEFKAKCLQLMSEVAAIKDYLAANVEIAPADLMRDQPFSGWGGVVAARKLFGAELTGCWMS